MIYTPLKPTNKSEIGFRAEIRTPKDSDDEETVANEITEVEYPQLTKTKSDIQNPGVRINVDVEIINQRRHRRCVNYISHY